ncbi:MAG: hypothetical protein IJK87_05185 [Prevotella sp.]|nr:hypothetical protein [Prevotella sp.]
MGDQRSYRPGRDFSSYLYEARSPRITINGVTGRMIRKKTFLTGNPMHLPNYSGKCDVYFLPGKDGLAIQAKVFSNHRVVKDFDWSHDHRNKDGTFFPKGTVHVQEYIVTKVRVKENGKWRYKDMFHRKSKEASLMTDADIKKYGDLIHYFNPNVKFR